jgi:ABC-2 type transport system permease protein
VFTVLFLAVSGSLLWLVPGEYNLAEAGYASLDSFFQLAPVLFLFLIPALSMHTLPGEKQQHTLLLLKSRPVSINTWLSAKTAALFSTALLALLPTTLYVCCLCFYGNPDTGSICASYTGLLFLLGGFTCLSVFASGLTANPVIALLAGLFFSAFFYFGWDLLAALFSPGKTQAFIKNLSFLSHYRSIQRGLIESRDLFYFLAVSLLFYLFTLRTQDEPFASRTVKAGSVVFLLFLALSCTFNQRFDCTQDRKYTLSPVIPSLLEKADALVRVELYLAGHLNYGFRQLQQSALHLLEDIQTLSPGKIHCELVNPYRRESGFISQLTEKGMAGIAVSEHSPEGKTSRNILFPYLLIQYKDKELPVSLLVNQAGRPDAENLNASIENLEYALAHSLQLLLQTEAGKILFLEGHGEFTEDYLHDILDCLSYEYTIDRGAVSGNPGELNDYDLVVIAGPQTPFPEEDKFVLDQYLMQGGRLLWFINGVQLHSYEELARTGETAGRVHDLNLDDLFFTYGLRINPVLLQDVQCLNIPLTRMTESQTTEYEEKPWYYRVLLSPGSRSAVTPNLSPVKTDFASTITWVGNGANRGEILLASSGSAHSVHVPATVSLAETHLEADNRYFNESHLPVAVLVSGSFRSLFNNRILPFSNSRAFLSRSKPTQMIVVASEELIRNELVPGEAGVEFLPLGYDRYSRMQFGNRAFVMNAVNYLTDNEGISSLKSRFRQLRLLDRQRLQRDATGVMGWNVVLPPLIVVVFSGGVAMIRKRKYRLCRELRSSSI